MARELVGPGILRVRGSSEAKGKGMKEGLPESAGPQMPFAHAATQPTNGPALPVHRPGSAVESHQWLISAFVTYLCLRDIAVAWETCLGPWDMNRSDSEPKFSI